jgi:hypothetical protein
MLGSVSVSIQADEIGDVVVAERGSGLIKRHGLNPVWSVGQNKIFGVLSSLDMT